MTAVDVGAVGRFQDLAHRFVDSDVFYSFKQSKITVVAAAVTATMFLAAIFAPLIPPRDLKDTGKFFAASIILAMQHLHGKPPPPAPREKEPRAPTRARC